jgi:hypothetical protein
MNAAICLRNIILGELGTVPFSHILPILRSWNRTISSQALRPLLTWWFIGCSGTEGRSSVPIFLPHK